MEFDCCGFIGCNDGDIILVYIQLHYLSGGQRNIQCAINIICYMYLHPYLSELRRQLILMLSLYRCSMYGRNVLLYIISVAPFLVTSLLLIPWACCGCMPIFGLKATQETIVPIVETFHRIWGVSLYSFSSTKEWGNLTANRRYVCILCCLGK